MPVLISGTTGIQTPLGSASAPADSNTTNSNTGLYFPTGTTAAIATNGVAALSIDASQNVTFTNGINSTVVGGTTPAAGTFTSLADSIGSVRSIPLNSQTSAYILAASDNGKMVSITTGGVTVNNSIMSAGMAVTIYNNSGSSQTITQGTGVTLQWAGQSSSTTGNRTLGLYGICTIIFLSASSAVISGAGLT